jgi:hypothetical protein
MFALWVGSKVQERSGELSMTAVFSVVLVLAAVSVGLLFLLALLQARYDRLLGVKRRRLQAAWLRSMRDERLAEAIHTRPLTAVERVVIASVIAAIVVFEGWFFFFAGSSLGSH